MTADTIVQFLLVDHIQFVAWVVVTICVAFKVWILYNYPSHARSFATAYA